MRRRKPLPKELQTARIDNLSHDAKGIARMDGKATFIPGALSGELVEFMYTRVHKEYDEGRLVNVLEPSERRETPKCPHYDMCGGCSLQHMSNDDQIQFKQEQFIDLLSRYGRTTPDSILPPLVADSWNYRNKARLSVRFVTKKDATMVGFRERNNPRYITEISQCPVLNSKVDANLLNIRDLLDTLEDRNSIAQIEVAAGDSDVALIFRNLNPLTPGDEAKIRRFSDDYGFIIFMQPGDLNSVTLLHPTRESDYLTYSLPEYDITFSFHPNDFTQVNSKLNRLMVKRALELMELQPQDIVLDLFCGLGNFSLPLARTARHVIGVEGSQAMVERAQYNALANQLSNTSFYAANLDDLEQVKSITTHKINKMLIDPPRSGALEVVKQIDVFNPERIVYVSCNPATLARDTDVLVNQKGYRLIKAGVMDMFPHTAHVESIALFIRD